MRRTVVPIELALSGIVPLIVVGWILICAVLAIKAHGRFDLVLWGMIALLPGMFFEYVFYLRSNQDKVSRNSVLLAMAMGGVWYVITVIAELIFTLLLISGAANFIDLETSPWWVSLIMISGFAVLVPGFFEELAKYLITYISSDENQHPKGVVIVALTGAITLASIENCQYVLTNFYASGQCCTSVFQMAAESILRDFFSVPIHAATGIIIGCGFAEAYANKLSPINCCGCILYLPVLLHGSYDGLLLWSGFEISQTQNLWFGLADLGAFGIVITAWVIALYKLRELKKYYPDLTESAEPIELDDNEELEIAVEDL